MLVEFSPKCPYCGSNEFLSVETPSKDPNVSYVLTTVNKSTKTFNATQGIPVDVYACAKCKAAHLVMPGLVKR